MPRLLPMQAGKPPLIRIDLEARIRCAEDFVSHRCKAIKIGSTDKSSKPKPRITWRCNFPSVAGAPEWAVGDADPSRIAGIYPIECLAGQSLENCAVPL